MDATKLIESLDAEQIRARLDEMDEERKALMTLLRAAQHRQWGKEAVARAAASIGNAIEADHEAVHQELLKTGRPLAAELQAGQEDTP